MVVLLLLLASIASIASSIASSSAPCRTPAGCQSTTLWHLPGPNPLVTPWRPAGSGDHVWMATECEVAGGVTALADGSLVLTYHCLNGNNSDTTKYQIGMSVSDTPLGPWSKPPTAPTLGVGLAGEWDSHTLASLNILPDPDRAGHWLGYYEGNYDFQSLGLVRAPHPLGPWKRDPRSPIMSESASQDLTPGASGGLARCFPKPGPVDPLACDSYYVATVMHGPHTNNTYFMYAEAPIGPSDEGPLALWVSEKAAGPFRFKAYILDGALEAAKDGKPRWDAGRYSESGVRYQDGLCKNQTLVQATREGRGRPRREYSSGSPSRHGPLGLMDKASDF